MTLRKKNYKKLVKWTKAIILQENLNQSNLARSKKTFTSLVKIQIIQKRNKTNNKKISTKMNLMMKIKTKTNVRAKIGWVLKYEEINLKVSKEKEKFLLGTMRTLNMPKNLIDHHISMEMHSSNSLLTTLRLPKTGISFNNK